MDREHGSRGDLKTGHERRVTTRYAN